MGSRRPLWITLIAAGTALVLGLGATTLILYLNARSTSRPEALVSRYLTDIQHGEIEKAMKLEGRTVGADQVLLTDEAYAGVSQQVSAFRIVRVGTTGPTEVRVEAELTAGGRKAMSTFTARHGDDGPVSWLGIHAWKLVPVALPTITLEVGTRDPVDVTIGHATVHWAGKPLTLQAFPGRYALAASSANPLYSISSADAAVTAFGQAVRMQAGSTLTDAGLQSATAATNAWVNGCLAGGAQPAGCSFGLDSGAGDGEVWTNVRWDMTAAPDVSIGAWDFGCFDGSVSGCWPVTTTTPGSVDFHADYSIPSTGERGDVYSSTPGEVDVEGSIVSVGPDGAVFRSVNWG